ncbi:DUF488 family protein [Maritimibacter sp. HL-12]|uniref:DUF488 domain-containing protein n=1 Tax=Maritimibacter sp. HL-12 TaxID=1162418 RepID=UPI000A0F39BF|nr:DUF488 domain-containing protein [Maritimibacter sp. HL-12]SMH50003.1 Uncharacterized conserved protein [Maritimibacter sp. HL-12]
MPELFTIGYEGASVDQLIQTLVNLDIEVLADVRELPLSRKKGLSKTSLAERLEDAGIAYRHFKQLGDPKAGRDAAKSGDYAKFESIFTKHLQTHESQKSLEELLSVAIRKRTCMLCFERCSIHCHRSIIADEAVAEGFVVYNLVADCPEKYLKDGIQIPRHRPRESLAAAE